MPRKFEQRLPVRNIVDSTSVLDQWLYWANLKNNFLGSNFCVLNSQCSIMEKSIRF